MQIVALYLAAIVAANLIVAAIGPAVSVLTALVFIGLNLTARDRLHDLWSGTGLRWKMAALIAAGGLLSWMMNADAARIAIASSVAFAASETVDALAYHFLRGRPWYERVNGSNTVSAAVDSFLFPALAFGAFLPLIVLGQFAAKVFGGGFWSWILKPRAAAVALLLLAAPLSAQVSAGIGEYHNEFVTQDVLEVYVRAPVEWVGFTPNVIVSFDLHGKVSEPVVLPQVGRTLVANFPVLIGADIGASAGAWDDYRHWEPHVSATALAFIRGPLKAVSIVSWQPFNEWARSVVVKLDWTF